MFLLSLKQVLQYNANTKVPKQNRRAFMLPKCSKVISNFRILNMFFMLFHSMNDFVLFIFFFLKKQTNKKQNKKQKKNKA